MSSNRINGRILAVAIASLAVVLVAFLATNATGKSSQPVVAAAPAAEEQATRPTNTVESESRSPSSTSSRGDRAAEHTTQESDEAIATEKLGSKGPGLASPQPSALEAAAAAALARKGPSSTVRVGIQAGHWKCPELPDELAVLRGSTGAAGPGWREVDVNVDVARKVVGLLAPFGIQTDLIPATVPVDYKADAFVAIHADANKDETYSGFKIARASWSKIPQKDDALVASLTSAYRTATGLQWHAKTITDDMREYYAFDHSFKHSVDVATPAVILEMGFLTNSADRRLILTQSDRLAQSIALGILNFLAE